MAMDIIIVLFCMFVMAGSLYEIGKAVQLYRVSRTVYGQREYSSKVLKQERLKNPQKFLPSFTPTQEISDEFKRFTISIDENRKKVFFKGGTNNNANRTYSFSEILSSEICIDGNNSLTKTSRSSQLAGGIVGGVLLGGTGAIIGGLSGKKITSENVGQIELIIRTSDLSNSQISHKFLARTARRESSTVKSALDGARRFHSAIAAIIAQSKDLAEEPVPASHADNSVQLAPVDSKEDNKPSVNVNLEIDKALVDQLNQLAKLRDEGNLTDDEYKILKNRLFSNI